jgi:hypothetical protein
VKESECWQRLHDETEHISISTHWWGFDIVTNEKLTQDIITGVTGAGPVGGLVAAALGVAGVVTGGVATIIGGAVAVIFAAKITEIKLIGNSNGVHWPIT